MLEYISAPCTQGSLQNYVFSFFQISSDKPEESLVIPTGKQYILFSLQGKVTYGYGKKSLEFHHNKLLVYVHHESYNFFSSENFVAFGIAMEPNGIYQFLGREFAKSDCFLTTTQGLHHSEKALDQLALELRVVESFQQRQALAERFLVSKLNNLRKGTLVSRFLEISESRDLVRTTNDIASLLHTNQRTMEMKFFAITGTTPGKYLRLKRFARMFQDFSSGKYSINELIIKYNYTDYSHLSRDFVKHTGKTPKGIKGEMNLVYYS